MLLLLMKFLLSPVLALILAAVVAYFGLKHIEKKQSSKMEVSQKTYHTGTSVFHERKDEFRHQNVIPISTKQSRKRNRKLAKEGIRILRKLH